MDEKLRDHLTNAAVARKTLKDIRNDLLDSIYEVYLAQVASEISSCEFVYNLTLREMRPPGRAIP